MTDQDKALEEVREVRKMIESTRQRVRGAWVPFLVFGAFGVLASLASQWLMTSGEQGWVAVPWILFLLVGTPVARIGLRSMGTDNGSPFVGRMLTSLWCGVAISILAIWIAAGFAGEWVMASAGTSVVLGLGVFSSGRLLDYPPLTWAALLWWVSAIAGAWAPQSVFGIEAVVIGLTYLLPAWGLYRQELGEGYAA